MAIIIGIDIGGTFTDIVALDTHSGKVTVTKVPSTRKDFSQGFFNGLDKILTMTGSSPSDVLRLVHGTTVATNAILEYKGAKLGILTTEGFRDTLIIGREFRTEMYSVLFDPETPGFGPRLSVKLVDISGGNLLLLLMLSAGMCFILGMGLSSIAAYITVAVLVAPALIEMGVVPLAAHLFILYYALTSFITPPVCVAVFVAAGIAGSNAMKTGLIAMRVGIATYIVPLIFVFSPALLLQSTSGIREIAFVIITSMLAILAIGIGATGYLLERVNWIQRILLLGAGFLLLVSARETRFALVGAVCMAIALLWHVIGVKLAKVTRVYDNSS